MEGQSIIPAATEEEKNVLHERLKALDPQQQGVTLNKLRVFYPRLGWGHILAAVRGLQADGRVKTALRGSPVQFEYITWQ